jgi:hypothetical protein
MTPDALRKQTISLTKQRNLAGAGMALALISLTMVSILALSKSDKVIIIPSTVDEYTITKGRVPDNYLINSTRDMANLLLNRHPHDTDFFKLNILRRVHPRFHDDVSARIAQDEIENKFKSGERVWRPSDICVLQSSDGRLVSEVVGQLDTYVNKARLSRVGLAQRFFWTLEGTQLYLVDTERMDPKDAECSGMEVRKS